MKKLILVLLLALVVTLSACGSKLDYSDFESKHLDSYLAAESKNTSYYYVYYYEEDCDDCEEVKEEFLSFVEEFDSRLVYFVDVASATGESTITLADGAPTIVLFDAAETQNTIYSGIDGIREFITKYSQFNEYDDFKQITELSKVSEQAEDHYFVYYTSDSCGYCELIKDYVLQFASRSNDAPVYIVNPQVVSLETYDLSGTPSLLEFKNGEVVNTLKGVIEVQDYLLDLEGYPSYDELDNITHFDDVLTQSEEEYLVFYHSDSCTHCISIKSNIVDFAAGNESNLKIYIINADNVNGLNTYGMTGTPSLLHIKNGEVVDKIAGSSAIPAFLRELN